MNYITIDYILDNHTDIDGWRPQYSAMSGSLSWYNTKFNFYINGTPNTEIGEVPLGIYNLNNGETLPIWELVFQTNSPLVEQLGHYIQNIKNAIKVGEGLDF